MSSDQQSQVKGASVTIDGNLFSRATDKIPLSSGSELLIYIKDPDNVNVGLEGKKVSISILTNRAKYNTELNIDTATIQ